MDSFRYVRAKDESQAITFARRAKTAQQGADIRYIAGGTTLVDLMKLDVERPRTLIDITHLPLTEVKAAPGGGVEIGAMVRNSDLAHHPLIQRDYPVGSGANSRRRKASRVVLSRLQAWSMAFHTAGASRPWTPRRPSPNCPLRMRCINSIPAIVIAAVAKPLKPSIVAIRCFTPRWSCSIRLFKYFDDRSFVSAGSKPSAV